MKVRSGELDADFGNRREFTLSALREVMNPSASPDGASFLCPPPPQDSGGATRTAVASRLSLACEASGSFLASCSFLDMDKHAHHSASSLNFARQDSGRPLLLLHGLGGNLASWDGVAIDLARTNEVIAVDLPGHGASPVLPGSGTFGGIADAVADFIRAERLEGVATVGMSFGGRVALEMARRGLVGATVALAPGGFWNAKERRYLKASLLAGGRLSRLTLRALPFLTRYKVGRAALLTQISARPGQVSPETALRELRSFATTPTFNDLVQDLAEGPVQEGTDSTPGPVMIVWGRKDRLLLPRQAEQARGSTGWTDAVTTSPEMRRTKLCA